jgi:hypothetical protein
MDEDMDLESMSDVVMIDEDDDSFCDSFDISDEDEIDEIRFIRVFLGGGIGGPSLANGAANASGGGLKGGGGGMAKECLFDSLRRYEFQF